MADNDGENRLIAERRAKLAKLRDGGAPFPNRRLVELAKTGWFTRSSRSPAA